MCPPEKPNREMSLCFENCQTNFSGVGPLCVYKYCPAATPFKVRGMNLNFEGFKCWTWKLDIIYENRQLTNNFYYKLHESFSAVSDVSTTLSAAPKFSWNTLVWAPELFLTLPKRIGLN